MKDILELLIKRPQVVESQIPTTPDVEARAKQLQSKFPKPQNLFNIRIAEIKEKTKSSGTVAKKEQSRLAEIPLIGFPFLLSHAVRSSRDWGKRGLDIYHNVVGAKEIIEEKVTYNLARELFARGESSDPIAVLAKGIVKTSVDAWQKAESHRIQHPEDIEGHRRMHHMGLKVLETAATELGLFETLDTKIKGKFDINIPEISKFVGLGFLTMSAMDFVKAHLPEFNTYLAAMENEKHPDSMASRFEELAKVPEPAATTPASKGRRKSK